MCSVGVGSLSATVQCCEGWRKTFPLCVLGLRQAIKLDDKHLYHLSHVAGPKSPWRSCVCVWGGLAQSGILMWGNRHPKHYNGMRQMCAAALSIMSCCVEQSVLRILKVVFFFFLLLVGSCSFHL